MNIEHSWKQVLTDEFQKEYFLKLADKITEAYLLRTPRIFPSQELIFSAFTRCPFENVKVVILGQDPYHGAGQAHGLAFSVPEGVRIPPSLANMFKEINSTVNRTIPTSGNLEKWADQGVLLLNSVLTVEAGNAGAHKDWGWEKFTDAVIHKISDEKENVVFILWGAYAIEKGKGIDTDKHLILTAPHPSPLSAYRGFFGCNHFNKTNKYLQKHKLRSIQW